MTARRTERPAVSWWGDSPPTATTIVAVEASEEQWSGLYDSAGRKLMVEREPIGFVRLERAGNA